MTHRLAGLLALLALSSACSDKGDAGPQLSQSTPSLDFGQVPVDSSQVQDFTLSNTGSTDIDLLSVSLESGDAGSWKIDWSGSTTLTPGDSATVSVTFAPEAQGEALGAIEIRTSLDDPTLALSLSGSGGPSELDGDGDGYSPATGDCDDDRDDVFPGAAELCDGRDNDCDEAVPADEVDEDGDGYRLCDDDCDDDDPATHPGAEEICDGAGADNDCDGTVQDTLDLDGDGYSLCDGDCDDQQPLSWPGNTEICDYIDNDCSGQADDLDDDGDGFSECVSGGDCDDSDPDTHPILVDGSAGDGGDGSAEYPVTSVAAGLALLDGSCNTLVLRAGSYETSIEWAGGDLALTGSDADPEAVVLTAPKGERVLDASAGAYVALRHLTVSGASASEDGGALRATAADLHLHSVLLSGNSSGGDGGAIAVSSGSLELLECTFLDNIAADDGGAVAALSSDVLDQGSLYEGNQGARGGAVVWSSCSGSLSDGRFQLNQATFEGGALWLSGGNSLLLERLELWENGAAGSGGAVAISDLNDEDSVLRNLWVEGNLAGEDGGGIAISGSRSALTLANSDLLGNDADGSGGGLYLGADDATGTRAWSNLLVWNGGEEGLWAREASGADVAWNSAYNSSSGTDFTLGADEDGGENLADEDPRFVAYDPGDDPEEHDLSLSSTSSARDSGPPRADWNDLDGSQNDRGLTGGPGAAP